MGEDPNHAGNSRRWIIREVEDSLRRLGTDYIDLYQIHRPDPDDRHRRDARRADRPRPPGQGPLPSAARRSRPSRSSRRSGWPSGAAASGSRASSRRTRSSCGASRPTCCPTCQQLRHGRDPVEPAGRRLADRPLPQGRRPADRRSGARRMPAPLRLRAARRTSASSTSSRSWSSSPTRPACSLTHLAHGVRARAPGGDLGDHRARARWSSSTTCSTAADVALADDVLDRIDEIVAAGHQRQHRRHRLGARQPPALAAPPAATPETTQDLRSSAEPPEDALDEPPARGRSPSRRSGA